MVSYPIRSGLFFLGVLTLMTPARSLFALHHDWGGQVKARGVYSRFDEGSVWTVFGDEAGTDQDLSLRLTDTVRLADRVSAEIHYEALWAGGRTHETRKRLAAALSGLILAGNEEDDRRLMDLSRTIDEGDDWTLGHRLDRLSLAVRGDRAQCRIGRQALTWGSGLIFNPMDVFNPFAPTDTVRDYKIGDDMAVLSVRSNGQGETDLVVVPRRDEASGRLEGDQSSAALRHHLLLDGMEVTVLGAVHYDEPLTAVGLSRSLGQAMVRSDLVWTRAGGENPLSLVINLDGSFTAFGKNVYGLIEYYHSGLGHHDAENSLADRELLIRAARGELFVPGRNYLGGAVQIELHPLVSFHTTLIVSADDGSSVVLPRLVWDAGSNLRIEGGMALYRGGTNTAFGGIALPVLPYTTRAPDTLTLTGTWYF
ncbi:hypothetical protein JCM14469_02170 [Desulfatiferula olefinivorans]